MRVELEVRLLGAIANGSRRLKTIEARYGVDLNTAGKDNVNVLQGRWY